MDYSDNAAYQKVLLTFCRPGVLVLCSGGRLARHIRHLFRLTQLGEGKNGWIPPDIMTLNAWIQQAWGATWPRTKSLSYIARMKLWETVVRSNPPPAGLSPDLSLYETLDETYAVLVRHLLSLGGGDIPSTPIVSWRRATCRAFESLAQSKGAFHPDHLPSFLAEAVRDGKIKLPDQIVLAAFEAPAPIEQALFDAISERCNLKMLPLPAGTPDRIARAVSLPDKNQEILWLIRELFGDAQTSPLHRIGVVIPNIESCAPQIKRMLDEVMPIPTAGTAGVNISIGESLLERPLIKAALLPIRFLAEGEPRSLLLSLFLSSYYGCWAKVRDRIAQADRIWRKFSINSGLDPLLEIIEKKEKGLLADINIPQTTLKNIFLQFPSGKGAVTDWIDALNNFFLLTGFPTLADETDMGAYKHLRSCLSEMKQDLKDYYVDRGTFLQWLRHLLARKMVHVSGSEEAGIQILGLIESRGLYFDRLYVMGLSAENLPMSVRPFPLLDTTERVMIQGGTAESQFSFAKTAFNHLLAAAHHITLLRPEYRDAEPIPPSPFWPDTDKRAVVDLWHEPDAVWARADWLQQGRRGMDEPSEMPVDPLLKGEIIPESISVSELEVALNCPFKFLAQAIIGLKPLEAITDGVPPQERGQRLHQVLSRFTKLCREQGDPGKLNETDMKTLLAEAIQHVLSDVSDVPVWILEQRRWLGDEGSVPGLLAQWLALEQTRIKDGWGWCAEEIPFEDLSDPEWPFTLRGRIDRIDRHADGEIFLWDYKSGQIPSRGKIFNDLTAPQLPAYVEAAKSGLIPAISIDHKHAVSGGFIALESFAKVAHKQLAPAKNDWDDFLKQWRRSVALLGDRLKEGDYRADPYPLSANNNKEQACQYCDYTVLCGYQT
ncbi:MAG: PD-(D/E)XK nuclease family protein [Pseudomonadota bacterium]